jgi:hypothetical protein
LEKKEVKVQTRDLEVWQSDLGTEIDGMRN